MFVTNLVREPSDDQFAMIDRAAAHPRTEWGRSRIDRPADRSSAEAARSRPLHAGPSRRDRSQLVELRNRCNRPRKSH